MQHRNRARITGLAEPENGWAADSGSSVAGEVDQRWNAGSIVDRAERGHRGGRQAFHPGGGVVLVDVCPDWTGSARARESDQGRNHLRVAQKSNPLNGLKAGFLNA